MENDHRSLIGKSLHRKKIKAHIMIDHIHGK